VKQKEENKFYQIPKSVGRRQGPKSKEISIPTSVISFPYHPTHLVLNPSIIKILKSINDNIF